MRRTTVAFAKIQAERERQDAEFGGRYNGWQYTDSDWVYYIQKYANGYSRKEHKHTRETILVKCAAIAFAAMQARSPADANPWVLFAKATDGKLDRMLPISNHSEAISLLLGDSDFETAIPMVLRYCVSELCYMEAE